MRKKIQLRNIRIAYQTPLGIFDTVEEAERELARCDWDICLITIVRIGDKDSEGPGHWDEVQDKWVSGRPIEVTVLADDQGFEAPI